MDIVKHNRYDIYLVLIVLSTLFGDIGGGASPARVLSLILLPEMLKKYSKVNVYILKIRGLFVFWLVYALISFVWTPDVQQGIKDIVYYVIHMILFTEIIFFSQFAKNASLAIAKGMLFFVLISSSVGLWEILTDQHLYIAKFAGSDYFHDNGLLIYHRFASFTFGNYNSFVTVLVCCLPFLYYILSFSEKKKLRVLSLISLASTLFILSHNASRGGMLCFAVCSIVFLLFIRKASPKGGLIKFFIFVTAALIIIVYLGEDIIANILIRTQGENMLHDSSRMDLLHDGIYTVFEKYYGFGAGIGGGWKAMELKRGITGLFATHNLFLEIFMNFGLIILFLVILYLSKMYYKGIRVNDNNKKMLIWSSLLSLPFMCIINSYYLFEPMIWVYFASIFVFAFYQTKSYKCL